MPTVKIGVFIPVDTQLLDVACVDIFAMMGDDYLSSLKMLPQHTVDLAPRVEIFYITSPRNNSRIPSTANTTLGAANVFSDPEVQPGELDIVLIPGANPAEKWEKDVLTFLSSHARCKRTDILCICTGVFLCGAAGILDGRRVSGPRGLQGQLKKEFPGVTLVGEEYRWVQDGNFWSSGMFAFFNLFPPLTRIFTPDIEPACSHPTLNTGGVTNGNDLVAAYARTQKHFPGPIADMVCKMADVGDRKQLYSETQLGFSLGMIWVIIKSYFWRRT